MLKKRPLPILPPHDFALGDSSWLAQDPHQPRPLRLGGAVLLHFQARWRPRGSPGLHLMVRKAGPEIESKAASRSGRCLRLPPSALDPLTPLTHA